MKAIKKIPVLFLIAMFSSLAYSLPVKKVYRGDSRPPEEVFHNGFYSWSESGNNGININFNAHILGISGRRAAIGTRNDAFIPTSSNPERARDFAYDLMDVSENGVAYLYTIRATEAFYSATDTMYHNYDASDVRISNELRSVLAREQEYAAYRFIPSELIESVTIYTRLSNNGGVISTVLQNENYIRADTHSNEIPFTSGEQIPVGNYPILLMGSSLANINNSQPEDSSTLPSPQFNPQSLFSCFSCFSFK